MINKVQVAQHLQEIALHVWPDFQSYYSDHLLAKFRFEFVLAKSSSNLFCMFGIQLSGDFDCVFFVDGNSIKIG